MAAGTHSGDTHLSFLRSSLLHPTDGLTPTLYDVRQPHGSSRPSIMCYANPKDEREEQ